jgi:hypothetical protein
MLGALASWRGAAAEVPDQAFRVPWNMPRMRPERRLRWNRCLGMETPMKYREFAEECERLAKQAKTAQHRRVLEEMARTWRQLANEAAVAK